MADYCFMSPIQCPIAGGMGGGKLPSGQPPSKPVLYSVQYMVSYIVCVLVRGVGGRRGCTSPLHVSSLLLLLPIKCLQYLSRISDNISSRQRQCDNIRKISDNATSDNFLASRLCRIVTLL